MSSTSQELTMIFTGVVVVIGAVVLCSWLYRCIYNKTVYGTYTSL